MTRKISQQNLLPVVVTLLQGFKQIKKQAKPTVTLPTKHRLRLEQRSPARWRQVYHWIQSEQIYTKN